MVTLHHLTPRERGGKPEDRTEMCRPCHKQVHASFGNVELERVYNSIEQLRAAPQMRQFIKWIRKQDPHTSFRTAMSNDHIDRRRRRAS
jgi:5-methylcytosine-specific restriction protein A